MMECYLKVTCPACCGCAGASSTYDIEAKERSNAISQKLREEGKRRRRQVKILLLGAGESGKTTFLKQMRILHGNGFTDEDLIEFRRIIHTNVVMGLRVLCDARSKLSIPFQFQGNEGNSNLLLSLPRMVYVDSSLFQGLVPAIEELWGDGGVQETWGRRAEFQISESVAVFCGEIGRIGGGVSKGARGALAPLVRGFT